MTRHIVVLQYAGDYAEAFWRLRAGGAENYAGQEYSVRAVAQLVDDDTRVTSVCCVSPMADDQLLPNGVRSIALGLGASVDPLVVSRRIDALQPTHLLLRTPMLRVLTRARQQRVPVVATFADSFLRRGFLAQLRYHALARELNDPNVLVVGNHGRNACRNLVAMGVRPEKVVAWDWPQVPSQFEPKTYPAHPVWNLVYAGAIDARKGVGDAVEAVALLRREGLQVRLQCFGTGALDVYRKMAAERGVADAVEFSGEAPNATVRAAMREADVVLVPSRHTYPEGLPLTIYEALQVRTPIVGSDHPMFEGILVDDVSAKVFRAADAGHLARTLRSLMRSPETYEALSRNAPDAWAGLQIETQWGDLVREWLAARPSQPWPEGAIGNYAAGIAARPSGT
jgi:glycosyltransferase involved in cell wall biosynthesis